MHERREKEQGGGRRRLETSEEKGEALSLLRALMEPRGEENSFTRKRREERSFWDYYLYKIHLVFYSKGCPQSHDHMIRIVPLH